MKTIGLYQAKAHLSEIIKSGVEVCLTSRGKEIAVIVPFNKYQQTKTNEIFKKLADLKLKAPLGNEDDIIIMKNQGRK